MENLEKLQTIAQLIDRMEASIAQLEKSYNNNDSNDFNKSKQAILEFQAKISKNLK